MMGRMFNQTHIMFSDLFIFFNNEEINASPSSLSCLFVPSLLYVYSHLSTCIHEARIPLTHSFYYSSALKFNFQAQLLFLLSICHAYIWFKHTLIGPIGNHLRISQIQCILTLTHSFTNTHVHTQTHTHAHAHTPTEAPTALAL